nr:MULTISPECIES: DUF1996 domain-containing protein [unclassified Streptomyces]
MTPAAVPAGTVRVSESNATCAYSHSKPDDPIVVPGLPGASRMHGFFGNRSTDAFTTTRSLPAHTGTSRTPAEDLSAYWIPTLYEGGRAVETGRGADGNWPVCAPRPSSSTSCSSPTAGTASTSTARTTSRTSPSPRTAGAAVTTPSRSRPSPSSSATRPPEAPRAAAFNATDTAWIQLVIPMNERARLLTDLAPSRTKDPALTVLAARTGTRLEEELAGPRELLDPS